MHINGKLACACSAAYGIDPKTGDYSPDTFYEPKVGYTHTPVAKSAPSSSGEEEINACLIGATASEIIVAFRGTLFCQTNASFEDWLQDFNADTEAEAGLPGKVHSGFYEAVNSISAEVLAEVQKLRGTGNMPVYVTGHSKGGGMAPIFAYLLYGAGITPEGVVTFAAPMSGDNNFAAGYNAAISNHTRYENFGDLVPMLPPTTEFISAFVNFVAPYKEYIPAWIYDFIVNAETWNYTPVGTEEYIGPSLFDYVMTPNASTDVIASDIVVNIVAYEFDIETALISAHTIQCGYGYFSAMCPSILHKDCPTKKDDVAAMAKAARPKQAPNLEGRPS